jgi:hypothetical protein
VSHGRERLQLSGPLQERLGLGRPVQLRQHPAHSQASLGIVGLKLDRPLIVRQGLLQFGGMQRDVAQPAFGLFVEGIVGQGGAIFLLDLLLVGR